MQYIVNYCMESVLNYKLSINRFILQRKEQRSESESVDGDMPSVQIPEPNPIVNIQALKQALNE